jgi:hypothetical protein
MPASRAALLAAGYSGLVSTSSPDVDSPGLHRGGGTDVGGTDVDGLRVEDDALPASDAALPLDDGADPRVEVVAHSRGPVGVREWPLGLVIVLIAAGLGVIAIHHFRWGSLTIAGGTLVAAVLRSVLPARRVGLLAVRGRVVDVVTMGGIGIALMVLALVTKT